MGGDLLQPALLGFLLDRFQFFCRAHALTGCHVGELDPLEPVLVQLVEVDGEIQDPHEDVPLASNGPGCGLGFESGRDVGQPILGCQRVQSALAKARGQVCVDDRFRPGEVEPFLHMHRLPVEWEEGCEGRGGGAGGNR
ncbi:MAG: hypothetical protein AAB433_22720 [Nitrospirota bacterium]